MGVSRQPRWLLLLPVIAAYALPRTATAVELVAEHTGPLVLGEVLEVPLTVRVDETEADAVRPLRMSVNVGEIGPIARIGLGQYQAKYTLPTTRYPQVALFAIWRETGPDAPIAFARVPLSGRTKVPVETVPEATVEMVVGETIFGPVVADATGKAKVEVAVPPGTSKIIARSNIDGRTRSQPVRIGVPPYNRVTVAITPYAVPADGASRVSVHVYYDSESPPRAKDVTVDVGGVQATRLSADGGHYRFEYRPARSAATRAVAVTPRVAKDPHSKASVELQLRRPTPEVVRWPPVMEALPADGTTKRQISLLITDRLGLGVPGLALDAEISAGTLEPIQDIGEGRYDLVMLAPSHLPDDAQSSLRISTAGYPDLTSTGRIPLIAPPWPTAARLEISPDLPVSDGVAPVQIRVHLQDLGGQAFEGGVLRLHAAGREAPILLREAGDGVYEGQVVPTDGEDTLQVELVDATGHLSLAHRARLRPAPHRFSLGARVGGFYDAQFVPEAGIEARYRLPLQPSRRFSIFADLSFRRRQRTLAGADLDPSLGQDLQATLMQIPFAIGASADLWVGPRWQLYAGLAGLLMPFEHRVTQGSLPSTIKRDIGVGGRAHAGFELYGGFAELRGEYTTLLTSDFEGGGLGMSLTVGYRWGLL